MDCRPSTKTRCTTALPSRRSTTSTDWLLPVVGDEGIALVWGSCRLTPHRRVNLRKEDIAGGFLMDFGQLELVSNLESLTVHLLPSGNEYFIGPAYGQRFLEGMHHDDTIGGPPPLSGYHHRGSSGKSEANRFIGLAAHDQSLTHRESLEALLLTSQSPWNVLPVADHPIPTKRSHQDHSRHNHYSSGLMAIDEAKLFAGYCAMVIPVRIRDATANDADAIAGVPVATWREAHRLEAFDGIHPLIHPLISLAASSTPPILNPTPQTVSKP